MKIWSAYMGLEYDTQELDNKFGTVQVEDKTLYLVQLPYIDGQDGEYHRASAIDAEGEVYQVTWDTKEDWDGDDGGDACNWEDCTVYKI